MKFASWSVNGLRARTKKGEFIPAFKQLNADVFAVQVIKMQSGSVYPPLDGYQTFWNYGESSLSGTAVFSRVEPKGFTRRGIGEEDFDHDGRSITLDFGDFFFVNVYVPNFQSTTWTKPRIDWEKMFLRYLKQLDLIKPVVVAGNFNVAYRMIDLKYPEKNLDKMGFRDDDRRRFSALLASGFVDTFRFLHPTTPNAYTWWIRKDFRERNDGWRIDYFLVSERLKKRIVDATIESEIFGTNHCPITLTLS